MTPLVLLFLPARLCYLDEVELFIGLLVCGIFKANMDAADTAYSRWVKFCKARWGTNRLSYSYSRNWCIMAHSIKLVPIET